jgi:hypothetical protein
MEIRIKPRLDSIVLQQRVGRSDLTSPFAKVLPLEAGPNFVKITLAFAHELAGTDLAVQARVDRDVKAAKLPASQRTGEEALIEGSVRIGVFEDAQRRTAE